MTPQEKSLREIIGKSPVKIGTTTFLSLLEHAERLGLKEFGVVVYESPLAPDRVAVYLRDERGMILHCPIVIKKVFLKPGESPVPDLENQIAFEEFSHSTEGAIARRFNDIDREIKTNRLDCVLQLELCLRAGGDHD